MLMSNEFVRAEDKYRRELLQDQNRKSRGTVGKTVVALVVAGALVLAACGVPQQTDSGAVVRHNNPSSILRDPGPSWQPNLNALPRKSAVAPAIEFGGMAAPTWQPNAKALEEMFPTPDVGVVGDSEPTGHPNYGRLATYLGEEPTSGPR